jgi:predicted lipid-binding transport protein (Tim44 family)
MTIRPVTTKMAAMAVALTVALAPALAEAKAGSGGSFGSRGARTYSSPAPTQTAPGAAQPMQRSMTPQSQPGAQAPRPATPAATAPAAGGFFGSTLGRGLMAGLLGAGIFGLLSGSGLFSGLGSMSSIFGLLLQIGLIFLVVKLVMSFIARRREGQMATATPHGGMQRDAFGGMFGGGSSTGAGAAASGYGAAQAAPVSDLQIGPDDFSAFERKLSEIQSAYGEEDLNRLRRNVTPEIASYFAEDLAENARKGVINKVSGAKLLSGDLSESWREGNEEFATVAMRFSLMDTIVDRNTGAYVSGDRTEPSETTEIWTFERPAGKGPDAWKLSAIQQTA